MKYKALKKRLVMELVISLAILSVVSGIAFFLDSVLQQDTEAKTRLESEVISVGNETNGLRERFIRLQKDQDLYQLVMNLNNADMLSHNTGIADLKFKEFEERFSLNSWSFENQKSSLTLDPAAYQRKSNIIVARDATINFEAANDEDIFDMMREMQKDFPGAVNFTKFTINRESNVTDEALRTITQRGSFSLVKGSISLVWYAIEPTDPEELKRRNEANKRPRRRR
jgi:hypothetical protein